MSLKDTKTFCPKSQAEWREWLEKHHQSEQSIWVIYYKASTKINSLTWSQAVDEALCFGWIDSTKKTIDEEKYMQYFSKRKPDSTWSKVNKDKVEQLIANKKMTPAGLNCIDIAKKNGSWTILDKVEALEIPEDLKAALESYKGALQFFQELSKSAKKILLYWVVSAKRTETREKRILEIAENAGKQLKPKQFR